MIVYDLETFNTDKAVPCASCIYRLKKLQVNTIERYNTENMRNIEKIVLFSREQIVLIKSYTMCYNSKVKLKKLVIKLLNIIYTYLLIKDQDLIHM